MKNGTVLVRALSGWIFGFGLIFSSQMSAADTQPDYPSRKVAIVGGSIAAALESYYAYLDSVKTGVKTRIAIYEKSDSLARASRFSERNDSTTTAYNITASFTPDEILSVVPRGTELVEKLAVLFSEPGGIRVDDVTGANDSEIAICFKEAVELYGKDPKHDDRTQNLLRLGKLSMDLWQNIYDTADEELKSILTEANYNPCRNPSNREQKVLHDGFRIDLLYGIPDAPVRAEKMKDTYLQLGYSDCKILTPGEVQEIDPYLRDYCLAHSEIETQVETGVLVWKKDSSALWRPGGCISPRVFLPKLYDYLKKAMGTFVDSSGKVQDYFTIEFNKEVTGVEWEDRLGLRVKGLKFSDGTTEQDDAGAAYADSRYVFCPGEAIGTLRKCGFEEPTYAGFAGASLLLDIPLSAFDLDKFRNFSHCMEVHKVGIVLAWQARFKENRLLIGVAGTKSFYADQIPNLDQEFAKNRHWVQLNMINDVLPEMVSIGCGFDTKGLKLEPEHLDLLEKKGILERWVGRRAVAYDGFPTLGSLYCNGRKVLNARCTTHLGSGGVSFSPAAAYISRCSEQDSSDEFVEKILMYADSRRTAK